MDKSESQRWRRRPWWWIAAAVLAGASPWLFSGAEGGAFAAGWLWAGLAAAAGLWLVLRGAARSDKEFLRMFFRGMVLKLVAYALAVLLAVEMDLFEHRWFLGGLLGGMVFFLALEVILLAKAGGALLGRKADGGAAGNA